MWIVRFALRQLGDHTYFTAGLTLTWNIFDRFFTTLDVERTRVTADNTKIDNEDLRLRIEGDVRRALYDYQGATTKLESSRAGLYAAKKAFDVMQGRYEVGSSSFVDLVTAQDALVQAESQRIQAQVNFVLQRKLIDFFARATPIDGTI